MSAQKPVDHWADEVGKRVDHWAPPEGLPAVHPDGMGGTQVRGPVYICERRHHRVQLWLLYAPMILGKVLALSDTPAHTQARSRHVANCQHTHPIAPLNISPCQDLVHPDGFDGMKEGQRAHPDGFGGQAKPPIDHWAPSPKKD